MGPSVILTLLCARIGCTTCERQSWPSSARQISRRGARGPNSPVFVADAVPDGDFGQICHDCLGGSVHEVQRPPVVGLCKAVPGAHPGASVSAGARGRRGGRASVYFVKARPSTRTTIQVFGSRESLCSKLRTYSNLTARQRGRHPRPGEGLPEGAEGWCALGVGHGSRSCAGRWRSPGDGVMQVDVGESLEAGWQRWR